MTELRFDISTKQLARLVKPVVPLAHKDGMMPLLNTVRLEAAGDYLTASATDRFRIGICRVKLESPPPVGLDIKIRLAELATLLSVFRSDAKVERTVTITVLEDRIKVEQAFGLGFFDASMTFPLESGEFPNLTRLFAPVGDIQPAPAVGLNASLFADFRHAVREGEPLIVRPSAANKPVIITAGDHFLGAIMPTRISDGGAASAFDQWSDILANKPAPKSKKAAA